MKISVPGDYHPVFKKALAISQLILAGKPAEAFSLIEFSPEAKQSSIAWGFNLEDRKHLLMLAESKISAVGYIPNPERVSALQSLIGKVDALGVDVTEIEVSDSEAVSLSEALEHHTRFSLGQISDALDHFTLTEFEVVNELRHDAVRKCGASFGITNKLVDDDARNGWYARKVIGHHLAWKRNPSGGFTNVYDTPMKLGSITPQNISIQDPEFNPATDRKPRSESPSPSF